MYMRLFVAAVVWFAAFPVEAGWARHDLASANYLVDTSVALDSAGRPSVAHGGGQVRLFRWDGVAWVESATGAPDCRLRGISLAFDPADRPWIAYAAELGGVSVTRFNGVAWLNDELDSYGKGPSIAIDAGGLPWVSYCRFSALKVARFDGASWSVEVVENLCQDATSLTLDAAGNPMVADRDSTNKDLRLARRGAGSWVTETVDAAGDVGLEPSLKIDRNGKPVIAYYDAGNADLKVARFNGTSWLLEAVDSSGDVGHHPSLAIDPSGKPVVAYVDGFKGFKRARWNGSAWVVDALVSDQFAAGQGLAIDPGGNSYMSYVGDYLGAIKLLTIKGNKWTTDALDPGHRLAGGGIALDAAGLPHVAYSDAARGELYWARFDGQAWQVQFVDGDAVGGSIAIDPGGRPIIVYGPFSNNGIGLWCARFDGSSWKKDLIDGSCAAGSYASLELDAAGLPLISYIRNLTLRLARFNGATWTTELVNDPAVPQVNGSQLELDSGGKPIIAYHDFTTNATRLARFDGATWSFDAVDPGIGGSFALDPQDRPCFVYTGSGNQGLRLACRVGVTWQVEAIDTGSDQNLAAGLVYDLAGLPRIHYNNYSQGILMRARFDGSTWTFDTVDDTPNARPGLSGTMVAFDAQGTSFLSYFRDSYNCEQGPRVAWEVDSLAFHRGVVADTAPGWQAAALPLTAANDDPTPPFPLACALGESKTDAAPAAARLVLYRLLRDGVTDMGNVLRAIKDGDGVRLAQ